MGENRNNYLKTDHDATLMHMKEEHKEQTEKFKSMKYNRQNMEEVQIKSTLNGGLLCFALNIKRMNNKDIEKLKEEAMAKAIMLSKNVTL